MDSSSIQLRRRELIRAKERIKNNGEAAQTGETPLRKLKLISNQPGNLRPDVKTTRIQRTDADDTELNS